jgi:3-hydroxyisobutyrate dehydrogenase-like beta-hydroxyacid dehydrogenase
MSIPSDPRQWRVGLVGYGEVGRILAEELRQRGLAVAAYDLNSPWWKSGVAPRRARHPAGKARRLRIWPIFDGGATQPAGMHRPSNAVRLPPRAVKLGTAADAPLRRHAAQHDVFLAGAHDELASQADFIVSAVTSSQTVAVAESCAPAVKRDAFFLDRPWRSK